MKRSYTTLLLIFVCLGLQAQAAFSPNHEAPTPVVDPVQSAPSAAEMLADGVEASNPTPMPVFKIM